MFSLGQEQQQEQPHEEGQQQQQQQQEHQHGQQIFDSIPSPPEYDTSSTQSLDGLPGLRVRLFQFQKNSVHKMLEMEEDDNKHGGVLAEEMGRGKTVICLALVVATVKEIAKIPDGYSMERVVADLILADGANSSDGVPSLKLLSRAAVATKVLDYRKQDVAEEIRAMVLSANPQFCPSFVVVEQVVSKRRAPQAIRVFASSSTLIVAPSNLIDQWQQQILKVLDTDVVSVLIVGDDRMPTKDELMQHDLVLVSIQWFSQLKLPAWLGTSGYSNHDDVTVDTQVNAFVQVLWKRLIVDEGHVVGNQKTTRSANLSMLFAERRWICSGTPAPSEDPKKMFTHILGLTKFLGLHNLFRNKNDSDDKQLKSLLAQLFVRTSSEICARDAPLPDLIILPATKLRFRFEIEQQRYNEIVALIKSNLESSRGEGQQSFFHTSNRKHALAVLENLQISCLHGAGLTRPTARETLYNVCEDYYRRLSDDKPDDVQRRQLVYDKVREVLLNCSGVVSETPLKQLPDVSTNAMMGSQRFKRRQSSSSLPNECHGSLSLALFPTTPEPSVRRNKQQKSPSEFSEAQSQLQSSFSALPSAELTTSTKLAHLIDRLRQVTPTQKVIVFGSLVHPLQWLVDALHLIGISYVEVSPTADLTSRSASIAEFQTDDSKRVIVMNLGVDAYGIDLSVASYVIFLEPVLDEKLRRQAIGRAHRFGQHNCVTVETLVMEGTIEETLFNQHIDRKQESLKVQCLLGNCHFVEHYCLNWNDMTIPSVKQYIEDHQRQKKLLQQQQLQQQQRQEQHESQVSLQKVQQTQFEYPSKTVRFADQTSNDVMVHISKRIKIDIQPLTDLPSPQATSQFDDNSNFPFVEPTSPIVPEHAKIPAFLYEPQSHQTTITTTTSHFDHHSDNSNLFVVEPSSPVAPEDAKL